MRSNTSFYTCVLILALSVFVSTISAQDRFINCRKFADGIQITIDGDPSDWPLNSYGGPATMADVPEGQGIGDEPTDNAFEDDALTTGDHFVYDRNKVLYSANSPNSLDKDGPGDFEATTYIGWNDEGFYLLNMVQDNKIGWIHGRGDTRDANNEPGFTNDGIEMWFDNDNDRFPYNINDDQTSEFDMQTAFSIDAPLIQEEFDQEPIMANGLPLEFAIFRSALNTDDDDEKAILDQIPRAVMLDDAPPDERTSYVQEIMFPWGVFPSFDRGEPIGFNINWIDWDDGVDQGDNVFQLMRWDQANESQVEFFREMRFTSDNPLGGNGSRVMNWTLF